MNDVQKVASKGFAAWVSTINADVLFDLKPVLTANLYCFFGKFPAERILGLPYSGVHLCFLLSLLFNYLVLASRVSLLHLLAKLLQD